MSYKLEIKNWKKRSNLCQKIAKFAKSLKSLHKRLIVGLPMASQFQETVEMDLKQHNGKILIHFIGLAACLSAATVIPNKNGNNYKKDTWNMDICVWEATEVSNW